MPPQDDVKAKPDSAADSGGGGDRSPDSGGVPVITEEMEASALGSPMSEVKNEPDQPSPSSSPSSVKAEPSDDAVVTSSVGGDITLKQEPGKPPKLARSASQKVIARPPQLFDHLPNSVNEATESFEVIGSCIYSSKYMGHTEHAMECDCAEEWGK
jgi:histone-lysine N-methyltransferase SETD2